MTWRGLRIGYVPYRPSLDHPADRRRFCFWARRRGVEVVVAKPGDTAFDIVVVASSADVVAWSRPRPNGPKVVYELIDSFLEAPATTPSFWLRGTAKWLSGELSSPVVRYRSALERMCRAADAVICSTPEQRARLSVFNANVHPILDWQVDVDGVRKSDYLAHRPFRLMWEGMGYTLDDLAQLRPALDQVAKAGLETELHLVTDLRFPRFARRFGEVDAERLVRTMFGRAVLYPWTPENVAAVAVEADLAVIALDLDDPVARAKPENKLQLFWSLGVPALTSRTPAYQRVMTAAGRDLTCASADDWAEKILLMAGDQSLRESSAALGRDYLAGHHSEELVLAKWDRCFETLRST